MISSANILIIAALALVTPEDGATVPLLRDGQKDYIAAPMKVRMRKIDDAKYRAQLIREGCVQKPLRLEWGDTGKNSPVELTIDYAEGGHRQTFTITNGNAAYITNLELDCKYRWTVSNGVEILSRTFVTEALPPRLLRIDGVINARDLGGWNGLDGRRVRQNLIFRCGGLRGSSVKLDKSIFSNRYQDGGVNVTKEALAYLRDELKIKTDIELRSSQETAFFNSSLIDGATWVKEPFSAYNFIDNLIRGREPFAKLFRYISDAKCYPILLHCSGGRDRTGTLAYLLLALLGVNEDDCSRDWEASIFSEESAEFGSARIARLSNYLHSLHGNNITELAESFAKSCGITDEEISAFRNIMLEEAKR